MELTNTSLLICLLQRRLRTFAPRRIYSNSFIFVIEWGRTNIGVVERALEVFSDMDEILLGVTLNKAI